MLATAATHELIRVSRSAHAHDATVRFGSNLKRADETRMENYCSSYELYKIRLWRTDVPLYRVMLTIKRSGILNLD